MRQVNYPVRMADIHSHFLRWHEKYDVNTHFVRVRNLCIRTSEDVQCLNIYSQPFH